MRLLRHPEARGIVGLVAVALTLAAVFLALTGKLTSWFGIRLTLKPPLTDRIVFVSDRNGDPDIWMMRPDGSDQRPLTNDKYEDSEPVVSPDGYTIVFLSKRKTTYNQLHAMDADGTHLHRISNITGEKSSMRFTADGRAVIFVCGGSAWQVGVDEETPDRLLPTHAQTVGATVGDSKAPYVWAAESFDGRLIGGIQSLEQGQIVVRMRREDEEPKPLTHESAQGPAPLYGEMVNAAWSPDTQRLAVTLSAPTGEGILAIADIGEQSVLPLLKGPAMGSPAWSPDGGEIAVEILKRVAPEDYRSLGLLVVAANGTEQHPFQIAGAERPMWSPDGSRLIYAQGEDIFSLDPETGRRVNLTGGQGANSDPAFAPMAK